MRLLIHGKVSHTIGWNMPERGLDHVLTIYNRSYISLPVEPKCGNEHQSIGVLGAVIKDVLKTPEIQAVKIKEKRDREDSDIER